MSQPFSFGAFLQNPQAFRPSPPSFANIAGLFGVKSLHDPMTSTFDPNAPQPTAPGATAPVTAPGVVSAKKAVELPSLNAVLAQINGAPVEQPPQGMQFPMLQQPF